MALMSYQPGGALYERNAPVKPSQLRALAMRGSFSLYHHTAFREQPVDGPISPARNFFFSIVPRYGPTHALPFHQRPVDMSGPSMHSWSMFRRLSGVRARTCRRKRIMSSGLSDERVASESM